MLLFLRQKHATAPVFLNEVPPFNHAANQGLRILSLLIVMHTEQAERPRKDDGIALFEKFEPHGTVRYGQTSTRLRTPVMMREITPPKEDGGGLAQKVGTVCKRHIADERATKASIGPMDGRRVLPLSQKHSIPINNTAHRCDKGCRRL